MQILAGERARELRKAMDALDHKMEEATRVGVGTVVIEKQQSDKKIQEMQCQKINLEDEFDEIQETKEQLLFLKDAWEKAVDGRKLEEERNHSKEQLVRQEQRCAAARHQQWEIYEKRKKRSIRTLSGGESFKAALCFALGLSDVIQSYAGGIQIDILFVDEGFGALDEESLNQAVDTLMQLAGEQRMIGIISHVEELKERIEHQIVITKKKEGSSIRM